MAAVLDLPRVVGEGDVETRRAAADEVWRSRTGTVLTIERDDHRLEVTIAGERVVGASVVVDRPSAELRAAIADLLESPAQRTAMHGDRAEHVVVHEHPAEHVVVLDGLTLHVVRDASGAVAEVVAAAPPHPVPGRPGSVDDVLRVLRG